MPEPGTSASQRAGSGSEPSPGLPLSARARGLQPSLTLAITAKAKQLRAEGRDICSLSAGEPDFDTPAFIRQAAAAALLDDLRNETLKSTRLEKIISRLVGELRAAKVHAASASLGGAESALATFKQLHARLEQQLLDNGAAVCMLQGEVRRGLEAVTTA